MRFLKASTAVPAVAVFFACGPASTPAPESTSGSAVTFNEAAWTPPREADIPDDSLGASIRRGLYLIRFTPESLPAYATAGMRCTSCHQDDGLKVSAAPLTGAHARYPKYMTRTGAVIGLADRVNYCFTRSLAGNLLPTDSREMNDILAYIAFVSHDVPVGAKIAGTDGLLKMPNMLDGDAERGKQLFTEKTCVTCHLATGEGLPPFPPLWGPKSFSVGASMARLERAASFIYHNMPQTAPGTLTEQEAFDLAAYVTSQPRMDSPAKEKDWPAGGEPTDVPYDLTSGHKAFRPPPLLKRATPERTIVPLPPVVSRGGGE